MSPLAVTARDVLALGASLAVAWFGGLVLGEYPFTGVVPVLGGFLMGVSVVGAAAFVEEGEDPPRWVTILGAALAVWAMWRAAWIDAGARTDLAGLVAKDGVGPLPDVAWYAMAAAGVAGLLRLIPKRRRAAPPEPEPNPDPEPDEAEA